MSTVENGNTVAVHYTGTIEGEVFDTSRNRGEPLMFETGKGMVIPGFNNAVIGMTVGESKTVVIPVDEAYGPINPEAVQAVSKQDFPEDFVAEIGASVTGQAGGQNFLASIVSIEDQTITLDFNHPLAGQELTFDIELVSIT
tara:strand:+ start:167 stop:592 length:426 start_codon:yes stop_codon:yes gene_type:complete